MLLSVRCSSIIGRAQDGPAFDLFNTMNKRTLDKAACLEDEARELHRQSRAAEETARLLRRR